MKGKRLKIVRPEIRIVGVDDGQFVPHSKEQVLVVGVVFRGGYWLEGVMSTRVTVDGFDATENIGCMINESPHYRQLQLIVLNGITFAGFNVVDIQELNEKTKLPVIAVTTKKPDLDQVYKALQNLPSSEERWKAVLNAGQIFSLPTRGNKEQIYIEIAGIEKNIAEQVLRLSATRSKIPEALRAAHLVASGISTHNCT